MQGRNFAHTALTRCVATLTLVTFVVGASTGKHVENASCASDDQALLQAKALVKGGVATCPADPSTDTEDPVIWVRDTVLTTTSGQCVIPQNAVTVSDNCPGVTWSCEPPSCSCAYVGQNTVDCTAIDAAGNAASASLYVTVEDNEDPVFDAVPNDVTVTTDQGQCGARVNFNVPTATDNCGVAQLVCSPESGTAFSVGTTTVTCTATDVNGNTAETSFVVKVDDYQDPLVVVSDTVLSTTSGQCVIPQNAVTVSDNCPGVTWSCEPPSCSCAYVGQNTVDCTAIDAAGNAASASLYVTVEDNEDPDFDAVPNDVTVTTDQGQCGARVNFNVPTASRHCGIFQVVCSPESGTTFPVGTTTVTCTATDVNGNTAGTSFVVNVHETEAPVFNPVPDNVTVTADQGQCEAVVNFNVPTAIDNCPGVQAVCSPESGTTFPVGTTTVTCTATDVNGNTAETSFVVNVDETEAPVFDPVPDVVTVTADQGQCGAVVDYVANATDNCPGVQVVCSQESGTTFPVGTTNVTCSATDASGNTASSESFVVQVNDLEDPSIGTLPNIDVQSCSPTTVTFAPTADDNCPGVSTSCSPSSGSLFTVGETEVTCTATDVAGSTSQKRFSVSVECDNGSSEPTDNAGDGSYYHKRVPRIPRWLHHKHHGHAKRGRHVRKGLDTRTDGAQ
ncbi:unnamed protein product [Symbiodinium sp. CCMP2592]|nr:unnamed protein product [Symbiodinium sp. CCMP2592]